jgi:hypothetical protein
VDLTRPFQPALPRVNEAIRYFAIWAPGVWPARFDTTWAPPAVRRVQASFSSQGGLSRSHARIDVSFGSIWNQLQWRSTRPLIDRKRKIPKGLPAYPFVPQLEM